MLTKRQVTNLCSAFANYLSADIKLSKTQTSKIAQSEGFSGRLLGLLLKTGLPLMNGVIQPLANDEMEDILKIVKSLEDSGILLKGVGERIKDDAKEQKGGFLSILLDTLGASLLGNMLAGKGVIRAGYGSKGQGTIRADYGCKRSSLKNFLIPPHLLTNFEIQMYYQNEPRFKGFILEIICLIK